MKLLVALSLLVCEANAFHNLGARVNELEAQAEVMKGLVQCLSEAAQPVCDEVCSDVIAISSRPFPTIESGTRYEVDGCVWKSKFYGAFVLNHRVVLHAIDATPARWRGDAGSSPLARARTAASSPRNDLVKNCRTAMSVHPRDSARWRIRGLSAAHGRADGRALDQAHGRADGQAYEEENGRADGRALEQAHGRADDQALEQAYVRNGNTAAP